MTLPRWVYLVAIAIIFFGIGFSVKAASMPKVNGTKSST